MRGEQDQIVAVDYLGSIGVAEQAFDLLRMLTGNLGDILGAVIGQATGDLTAVGVEQLDGIAALEAAANMGDADRQQAAAPPQGALSPGVQVDLSSRAPAGKDKALAAL